MCAQSPLRAHGSCFYWTPAKRAYFTQLITPNLHNTMIFSSAFSSVPQASSFTHKFTTVCICKNKQLRNCNRSLPSGSCDTLSRVRKDSASSTAEPYTLSLSGKKEDRQRITPGNRQIGTEPFVGIYGLSLTLVIYLILNWISNSIMIHLNV